MDRLGRRKRRKTGDFEGFPDKKRKNRYIVRENSAIRGVFVNPRVQEYLDSVQKEMDEAKARKAEAARKERDETLIALGLFTQEREYVPEGTSYANAQYAGYNHSEGKENDVRFYRKGAKAPIEVTDEEYEAILKAKAAKGAIEREEKKPIPRTVESVKVGKPVPVVEFCVNEPKTPVSIATAQVLSQGWPRRSGPWEGLRRPFCRLCLGS